MRPLVVLLAAALLLPACGEIATLPEESGYGPRPLLPQPNPKLLPTLNVARAKGWEGNAQPRPAEGFAVSAFARGLEHPRWLHVLPNGDVLVAETNAPESRAGFSLRGLAMKLFKFLAGAGGASPNRITLLRDTDGDGLAETRKTFLSGLNSPFGMALCGGNLYVANTDALMRYPYRDGQTWIDQPGTKLADLPGGPINHHWTKNVVASPDCRHLYVAVGSNSNVGENGLEAERDRAAILIVGAETGRTRVYASGLRNPVGMDWHPLTGRLWVVVNERDEIGSDLVPDYLTEVEPGGFYGWPYSYFGNHVDERVKPQRPDLVAKALVPDYALGAHAAALGLAFYDGKLWPARYRGGAFIAQHGSWNRKPKSGYRVVFLPFAGGRPIGMPEEVLGGFLREDGGANGRPVGLAVDRTGALLVADDVGGSVWRVLPAR